MWGNCGDDHGGVGKVWGGMESHIGVTDVGGVHSPVWIVWLGKAYMVCGAEMEGAHLYGVWGRGAGGYIG